MYKYICILCDHSKPHGPVNMVLPLFVTGNNLSINMLPTEYQALAGWISPAKRLDSVSKYIYPMLFYL